MKKNDKWTSSKKLKVFSFIENTIKDNGNIQLSCRIAIQHFNLDESVDIIRKRFNIYMKDKGKERSNMIFTIEMEQAIVGFIQA